MNRRFGHKAMKESYITDAKVRFKKHSEIWGKRFQICTDASIQKVGNVQQASLKTFLDNCSECVEFRLAVKRTRPKTIYEAVTAAMQEECIRLTENRKPRDPKILKPSVYQICSSFTNQDATRDIQEYSRVA